MNFEQYTQRRTELLNQAQEALDAGNVEQANQLSEEVTQLDNQFENAAATQANLNALSGSVCPRNPITDSAGVIACVNGGEDGNIYNSMEYRKAFMNHVCRGAAIPKKFLNADENTLTTDIPVLIPQTVLNRIIEKMEATGMIWTRVTRTAYKGGVAIPTSDAKPVATWVAEGTNSEKQKFKTGSITFSYFKLKCNVSMSMEVDEMALPVFESTVANNIAEAMVRAIEQSILFGNGTTQPSGFLNQTPADGQAIEIRAGEALTYELLIQAESALPLAYEKDAVWFMTKKTFMAFNSMVDSTGQPIARVNFGLGGKPERYLLGREVILNDYMQSFNQKPEGNVLFAALFHPKDYLLNTNMNMRVKKYEDEDTDDQITKAVMLVDGKAIDKNSLVTLTLKN